MDLLLSRILILLNGSPKEDSFYNIARYIVMNYVKILEMSSLNLAEECFVSSATIYRFCHYFGYNSYEHFMSDLRFQHNMKIKQMSNKLSASPDNALLGLMHQMAYEDNGASEFESKLQSLVADIDACEAIYLYGAATPLNNLTDFQTEMIVMGKPVFIHHISNQKYTKITIDLKVVSFINSLSGRFLSYKKGEVVDIVSSSYKSVMVVNKDNSKLNKLFDYLLLIRGKEDQFLNYKQIYLYEYIKRHYYQTYYQQ